MMNLFKKSISIIGLIIVLIALSCCASEESGKDFAFAKWWINGYMYTTTLILLLYILTPFSSTLKNFWKEIDEQCNMEDIIIFVPLVNDYSDIEGPGHFMILAISYILGIIIISSIVFSLGLLIWPVFLAIFIAFLIAYFIHSKNKRK